MNARTLVIAIIIASLFRHTIPYVDGYFLLFLFVMFRHPENSAGILKYFLIGTFFASFISGIAIGLLPLITTVVFLFLQIFHIYKAPKGLPTIILWSLVYIIISSLESMIFVYLSTDVPFVPAATIQAIIVTILAAFILRELAALQKKI